VAGLFRATLVRRCAPLRVVVITPLRRLRGTAVNIKTNEAMHTPCRSPPALSHVSLYRRRPPRHPPRAKGIFCRAAARAARSSPPTKFRRRRILLARHGGVVIYSPRRQIIWPILARPRSNRPSPPLPQKSVQTGAILAPEDKGRACPCVLSVCSHLRSFRRVTCDITAGFPRFLHSSFFLRKSHALLSDRSASLSF